MLAFVFPKLFIYKYIVISVVMVFSFEYLQNSLFFFLYISVTAITIIEVGVFLISTFILNIFKLIFLFSRGLFFLLLAKPFSLYFFCSLVFATCEMLIYNVSLLFTFTCSALIIVIMHDYAASSLWLSLFRFVFVFVFVFLYKILLLF